MNVFDAITLEQAKKDVDGFIEADNFFVLRNPDCKVVSIAGFGVTENQAKLSYVYTPNDEREKGYAANIIYLMTNELLKSGYVPLLYTDYNYISSNRAYINAGYEDTGILINFSFSKQKDKVLNKYINKFYI